MSTIPNAEITVPNVTRDLLMLAPSFSLLPVAPVEFALSLNENKIPSVSYNQTQHSLILNKRLGTPSQPTNLGIPPPPLHYPLHVFDTLQNSDNKAWAYICPKSVLVGLCSREFIFRKNLLSKGYLDLKFGGLFLWRGARGA